MAETEMVDVVIKMPKEKYDSVCNMYGTFPAKMKEWGLEYIKNGTALSKGHGRIIDESQVTDTFTWDNGYIECCAPTIIEADTQNKETENIKDGEEERDI